MIKIGLKRDKNTKKMLFETIFFKNDRKLVFITNLLSFLFFISFFTLTFAAFL